MSTLRATPSLFQEQSTLRSESGETVSHSIEAPGPFSLDQSLIFSSFVSIEQPRLTGRIAATAADINFEEDLACLVIRQFDASGKELAADASPGHAGGESRELRVEAAPCPGLASVRLEFRLSSIAGTAVFSRPSFTASGTRLYLPEGADILRRVGSAPALRFGGRVFPPLIIHGQNLATSKDVSASIRDMRLPYESGVRLLSFNAWFPSVTGQSTEQNFSTLTRQFPDAAFMIRLWLGPPSSFLKDYPEARLAASPSDVELAASYSPQWRGYVAAALRRFALELRKFPEVRRLVGVVPMYYHTGEWQLGEISAEDNPAAGNNFPARTALQTAYGDWLRRNGIVGEETPEASPPRLPTFQERVRGQHGDFRDPGPQANVIHFIRFQNESVADAIIWSSEQIKVVFHHRALAAPFYGYALEHAWSHLGLQQQGHLALGKVLESSAVDSVGGPYSYNSDNRAFGKPVDTNAVLDSVALHGKFPFLEEDTYTHLAKSPGQLTAPGEHLKTRSLPETLAVLRRNLGVATARGYALYWMGLLEDGRFDLPEIWQAYRPMLDWLRAHPVRPAYRPQVALVVDERAIPLLAENSRAVIGRWLYELRSILARVDTSMGVYLQSDLDRIPDSVRCLVLATPFGITKDDEQNLRERWMRDGRVVIFCHAPIGPRENSPIGVIGETSGIRLRGIPSSLQPVVSIDPSGPLGEFSAKLFGEPVDRAVSFWRPDAKLPPVNPHMIVEDPRTRPIARYANSENVAAALREMPGWTSVYTAIHSLSPRMWRRLISLGNAHFYLENCSDDFDHPDVIEATEDFVMIQSGRTGERQVTLPKKVAEVRAQTPDGPIVATDAASFAYVFEAGEPVYFFLSL